MSGQNMTTMKKGEPVKATYEKALQSALMQKKPSRGVYKLLLKAAEEGDARATYALATWHLHGTSFLRVDYVRGFELLKSSAKAGVAEASFDLAISYEKGVGTRRNLKRAFEAYVHAALLGDSQAFYEVGRMYCYGIGVSKNRRLADYWLDKAELLGIKE
jgi:uncharacterized protein